jgi:hypothetical protein
MKKIIICFLLLHGGFLHSADHKPQPQRRVECFSELVQAWRDQRATKQHVGFDWGQRSRPLHDEQKIADPKKSDKEKK